MSILHITNGDATLALLRDAEIPGDRMAWRDVLHDGPVPRLPMTRLSKVRARFVAEQRWAEYATVLDEFRARDAQLGRFRDYAEVVLWFEHDLYDQLQLIQILDWFASRDHSAASVGLICIGAFPGVGEFHGRGNLTPPQLASLWGSQDRVGSRHLQTARRGWLAFTSPEPTELVAVAKTASTPLGFLAPALRRFIEEFPDPEHGLGRSERQALVALGAAPRDPVSLFSHCQDQEQARFLGDWSFWRYLETMVRARSPLICNEHGNFLPHRPGLGRDQAFFHQRLRLTTAGERVLAGEADAIELNGIDGWRGGVRLRTADHWRWDPKRDAMARWSGS